MHPGNNTRGEVNANIFIQQCLAGTNSLHTAARTCQLNGGS